VEPIIDWEARYKEKTTAWERDHLNPAFNGWRARFQLNTGHAVVPGCGRAPEVLEFARMGWQVTGIDLADTAVAFQQATLNHSGFAAEVVQANVLAWSPSEPVDLVYEQTCLCALNPDHWGDYEAQLHKWLKPGGVLAVLFMQTDREGGPPFHCGLEPMRALFSAERWNWDSQSLVSEHPMGIHELGFWLTKR